MYAQLAYRLKEHGLTQTWLAEQLGIYGQRISKLIAGKLNNPQMMAKIEDVLKAHGIPTEGVWVPEAVDKVRMTRVRSPKSTPPPPVSHETAQQPTQEQEESPMFLTREYLDPTDLKHWNLNIDPFDDLDTVLDCWMGPRQKFVEGQIKRAVRARDLLCIVGEVGSGKSTLLRRFIAASDGDNKVQVINPCTVDRSQLSAATLTAAICRALSPDDRVPRSNEDRSVRVNELLTERISTGTTPVLVIEEAHDLSVEALIALKELWDSGNLYRLLTIILLGHGRTAWAQTSNSVRAIDVKLKDPRVRELAQRMRVVRVESLSKEELVDYLAWRFHRVGLDWQAVLEPSAVDAMMTRPAFLYPLAIGNQVIAAMRIARLVGDRKVTSGHVAKVGGKA